MLALISSTSSSCTRMIHIRHEEHQYVIIIGNGIQCYSITVKCTTELCIGNWILSTLYTLQYCSAAHFRLLLGLRLGVRVHWFGSFSVRCEERRRCSGGARRRSGWGGDLAARNAACSSRLLGLNLLLLLALGLGSHAQHRRIDLQQNNTDLCRIVV